MASKLIDLDAEDATICFTAGGRRYAFTRDQLVEALGRVGEAKPAARRRSAKRSQAAVGKALAWLLADIEGGRATSPKVVKERLAGILDTFDGKLSATSTRMAELLLQIAASKPGAAAKRAVDEFFEGYPGLREEAYRRLRLQEIMAQNVAGEARKRRP